jgi:hypothetical protein
MLEDSFLTADAGAPAKAPHEGYLVYTDAINFVYLKAGGGSVCRIGETFYRPLTGARRGGCRRDKKHHAVKDIDHDTALALPAERHL